MLRYNMYYYIFDIISISITIIALLIITFDQSRQSPYFEPSNIFVTGFYLIFCLFNSVDFDQNKKNFSTNSSLNTLSYFLLLYDDFFQFLRSL